MYVSDVMKLMLATKDDTPWTPELHKDEATSLHLSSSELYSDLDSFFHLLFHNCALSWLVRI